MLHCLFTFSTSNFHNSQPFTGEFKVTVVQGFVRVLMVKYFYVFHVALFLCLLSDTCVIEKSQTATSCLCNRLSEAG